MKLRNKSGITLIALIVTIVVLIIIAGISVSTLTGNSGVLNNANTSKAKHIEGLAKEQVELAITSIIFDVASEGSDYKAYENAWLIQAKLKSMLNKDIRGLNGTFDYGGNQLAENTSSNEIIISYTGNDYKSACNNEFAEVVFTIELGAKTIKLIDETNTTNETNDIRVIVPGLYKTGTNYTVLLKTWDELVTGGVIHVNNGILTTNYDTTTTSNSSTNILVGDLVISDSVKIIGERAFAYCSNITDVQIPKSVTNIEYLAFNRCSGIKNVKIPESVTNIGRAAFQLCTSLRTIDIPDSVTSIEEKAFMLCENLTNIKIPKKVTIIPVAIFENCTNLKSVELPDGITSIGTQAFNKCGNLTDINIPRNVTNIGDGAFQQCDKLESVEIPDSVLNMGTHVFYSCNNLKNVKLPRYITSIKMYSFEECYSLTNIKIPKSVTTIGNAAFSNCNALGTIYYEGTASEWNSIEKVVQGDSGDWDFEAGSATTNGTYTVVYNATI